MSRAKTYIFDEALKNGFYNMCYMLIFVKSKNTYFKTKNSIYSLKFLKSSVTSYTIKVYIYIDKNTPRSG